MSAADPTSYRFVPDTAGLERFFGAYERERDRAGMGSTLRRVSPGQRADTLVTILGLNACGGWQRVGGEGAQSLWLRYLTPVLAETGDSAAALAETARAGLPGRFEPAIPDIPARFEDRPAIEPERERPPRDPPWRRLALWFELCRRSLRRSRTAVAIAVVLLGVVLAGLYNWNVPQDPDLVPIPDDRRPIPVPVPIANGTTPTPVSDEAGGFYRTALTITLAAFNHSDRVLTPRRLAQFYAGESDMISDPSLFLAEMLRALPLPPDGPVPGGEAGRRALERYALVFMALENAAAMPTSVPALDRGDEHDARLSRALDRVASTSLSATAAPPPAPATWPGWTRWLAFAPLLAAAAWLLAGTTRETQAILAGRGARETGRPATLPVDDLDRQTLLPPQRRLARQIGWGERALGRRLNAERSIRATIARGGFLTPVTRSVSHSAHHVFLVPRRAPFDHESHRVGRLIDALERGGLSLDVYDYAPDPRFLAPRAGAGPRRSSLDLRGLREMHSQSRLVLVSDGSELVDFLTQRPRPFVAEELAAWPMRMLLTPLPMSEWGERELGLSEALGAIVGRATPSGFADLAVGFPERGRTAPPRGRPARGSTETGTMERLSPWMDASLRLLGNRDAFARRPPMLLYDDPALTSEIEPTPQHLDALVEQLRRWLGPRGFQWLAACAAYPQLRPSVTHYLGVRITVQRGPFAEPLFDETALAQLSLLPWFRSGRMPPWLRRALFAKLSPVARERARDAIDAMLHEDAGTRQAQLSIWRPEAGRLEAPPDAVMARLMTRERSDLTPLLRGAAFVRVFGEALRRRLVVRSAVLAAGFVWCLLAWLFWPDPAAVPHAQGAWLPLLAFAGTTLVLASGGTVWWFSRGRVEATAGNAVR